MLKRFHASSAFQFIQGLALPCSEIDFGQTLSYLDLCPETAPPAAPLSRTARSSGLL